MSKAFVRSIKNVTNGYTSAQVKVRNATSNDSWGPSTQDMQDIARLTYESHELFEVMDMLDRRMNDKGKNWRHVLKALTVLDYILHSGSENVVLWAKDNLYIVKTLREFQYIDDSGRDQGSAIRAKAKDLTELILDDDRLRSERLDRSSSRRKGRRHSRPPPANSEPYDGYGTNMSESSLRSRQRSRRGDDDSDFERALEESRHTAEDDEQRRKAMEGSDEDLRKAIALSEEEDRNRRNRQDLFSTNGNQQNQQSLIDTDFSQPQQTGYQYGQQVQYTGYPVNQNQIQYDIFGNPVLQQPLSTGMLQNAYGTGVGAMPQFAGYQQDASAQQGLYQQQTGYEALQQYQQQQAYQQQQQQQTQQQQPLAPLKTGSNNPFAQSDFSPPQSTTSSSYASGPSMNQQLQGQPTFTSRPNLQRKASQNFDANHMNQLNTLLATGEGIDTFGNVGDLRIPAQHTKSTMVNSAGIDLVHDRTGQESSNPFIGAQYTGIATTNRMQPAYTGYGFGNASQSQNGYGQQQHQHQQQQQGRNPNSLIDL